MSASPFPATGMPDRDWWQAMWPDPDGVVAALRMERGMSVADVGCGYGHFTGAIARRVAPAPVFALDLDPAMLEQATAACAELTNCIWLLGDAMELPRLVRAPLDYALIANTFHGAPDKTALARVVAGALKPGGQLAIVNWHAKPREATAVLGQPRGPRTDLRMSPEQARAVVEPAGFALEALVELPPYHYGAIFVRSARAIS